MLPFRWRLIGFWALLALLTAIAYALPIDQPTTDLISDVSFSIGALMLVASALSASRKVDGLDRIAWAAVGVSLLVTTIVFVTTPPSTSGSTTSALLLAPVVALAVLATILLFGRHALSRLGLARAMFDTAWLTSGLLTAFWVVAIQPIPDMVSSDAELFLLVCFPVIAIAAGVLTITLLPHSAGSARWSLASFGGGAAVLAVAGETHLRLAHTGDLVFGTWYDYLWTVGLCLLGIATADPTMGKRLVPATPRVETQQIVTLVPIVLAVGTVIFYGWERVPPLLGLSMLVLLGLRITLLMAELGSMADQLHYQANHDELTGLMNRRALLAQFRDPKGSSQGLTVLYIDLDGFKSVNDQFGHAAGDTILAAVGWRLSQTVRPSDAVARLGGDEFVVITDSPDARALASRIRDTITQPVPWADTRLLVGCSVGLAHGSRSASSLLAEADAALYEAKNQGRNTICERLVGSALQDG